MEYKTIKCETAAEITEQRSRFIGTIKPVSTEAEATEFIAALKQKYWDARHNVYAYILREGNIKRYSDDGEPHSTAGLPALETLTKMGLTDCVLVVTRYFGGILLGTGGLVRAYSSTARKAAEAAGVVIMRQCLECSVTCGYSDYARLENFIAARDAEVKGTDFTENITVTLFIPKTGLEEFSAALIDKFNGTLKVEIIGECYAPFEAKN